MNEAILLCNKKTKLEICVKVITSYHIFWPVLLWDWSDTQASIVCLVCLECYLSFSVQRLRVSVVLQMAVEEMRML